MIVMLGQVSTVHAEEQRVINVGFSYVFTSTSFKYAEVYFRTLMIITS